MAQNQARKVKYTRIFLRPHDASSNLSQEDVRLPPMLLSSSRPPTRPLASPSALNAKHHGNASGTLVETRESQPCSQEATAEPGARLHAEARGGRSADRLLCSHGAVSLGN